MGQTAFWVYINRYTSIGKTKKKFLLSQSLHCSGFSNTAEKSNVLDGTKRDTNNALRNKESSGEESSIYFWRLR